MTQEGNFGRPLGRFGVKNPIVTPGRAIGGRNIWLPSQSVTGTGGFSTATTGTALYAYSGTIQTVGVDQTGLWAWGDAMFVHSAPPASIDIGIFLDFAVAGGTGVYWTYHESLYIPSATLYTHFPLFGGANLKSSTNSYAFVPGRHTLGYVVVNNTVGTLTMATNAYTGISVLEIPWKILV